MKKLPLTIVTATLVRWIKSCKTYLQLSECEKMVERYVVTRQKEISYSTCMQILMQTLQLKRIDIQLEQQLRARKDN